MGRDRIQVLLIEDNPGDARLIREALAERSESAFRLRWADDLDEGLQRLADDPPQVVLLDLSLPGSRGLDTLATVLEQNDEVPIIVLTGTDDEALAVEAVRRGAQDYLVKGQTGGALLGRAVRYAIQRKESEAELADAKARLEAANNRLEKLATTDDLTGLWNRRHFLAMLDRECQRVARTGTNLAVVMVDVDHFKDVNDTCGHPFGDRVLQEVATVMQNEARSVDMVARYGGEEFMIFMPETGADEAVTAAERLRRHVAEQPVSDGGRSREVTISVGVADLGDAVDPTNLLRHADEALYAAKEGGRNRTCLWTDDGPVPADDTDDEAAVAAAGAQETDACD
jgi:diguanylate cyclase (GGDEF)-like protein